MNLIRRYISYIRDIRRYSEKTVAVYEAAILSYYSYIGSGAVDIHEIPDSDVISALNYSQLRSYMAFCMEEKSFGARTVGLHFSALSGFCRFLVKEEVIFSNPVSRVRRPRLEKPLPFFYRQEAMMRYFGENRYYSSEESLDVLSSSAGSEHAAGLYEKRLAVLIVSMLYGTGMRRGELIRLNVSDVDFGRKIVKVAGKGNKMREIPLIPSLCEEILLYLKAVEVMVEGERSLDSPLLVTRSGRRLYPMYVDRAVKSELGEADGITGQKSPHILRHSLATDLLDDGTDLNSIKELLGHASLAATQVYTHNTMTRLKTIYESAHPRAKNGGKNGD